MSARETPPAFPNEMEVQALWFEQLYQPVLATDDGRSVEVIQPGFWNHGGGPDFTNVAVRFSEGQRPDPELTVGNVEIHLRPGDWHAHGHDSDPAYNDTILHVVWDLSAPRKIFPATESFRRVPQVELKSQLIARWDDLQPICRSLLQRPLPDAVPGRCSPELARQEPRRVADILRAAGRFRLRQKAQRWFWRGGVAGREQALFEALAESLGFHANQIPMRLVAQRLPWKMLRGLQPAERLAHLFGLAGFLPDESVARLDAEPRGWLRELWEIWWKARASFAHALLPRNQWRLAGLRPLNRPERRLTALAHLVPQIRVIAAAIESRDVAAFGHILSEIRDPFWEDHATLSGSRLHSPCKLIGEERVQDILINVFWPLVSLDDPDAAQSALRELRAAPNGKARMAQQRLLIASLPRRESNEALIQQGLLQIFRDYCQADCSRCRDCTFPELVKAWRPSPGD